MSNNIVQEDKTKVLEHSFTRVLYGIQLIGEAMGHIENGVREGVKHVAQNVDLGKIVQAKASANNLGNILQVGKVFVENFLKKGQ